MNLTNTIVKVLESYSETLYDDPIEQWSSTIALEIIAAIKENFNISPK